MVAEFGQSDALGPSRTDTLDLASSKPVGYLLILRLLQSGMVLSEDWDALPLATRETLAGLKDQPLALRRLVEHQLLTEYQANLIGENKTFGLILGNYRVLERINAGGMGIIFKAEHLYMRRVVAIKVLSLPLSREYSTPEIQRFYAEVRVIAQLKHPNIVEVLEAGETREGDEHSPILHYYVMEYLQGHNLEELVEVRGPLPAIRLLS